jgi:hypothetical protein
MWAPHGYLLGLQGLSRASQDFSIAMGRNLIGDANQQNFNV